MNRGVVACKVLLITLILTGVLVGCGGSQKAAEESPQETAESPVAEQAEETEQPDVQPTRDLAALFGASDEDIPDINLSNGVSGIGSVKAKQDADLVFTVNGTVQDVFVEEGDSVSKDQVLAVLDVRSFDHQITRSEASVMRAEAAKTALYEEPRKADKLAAEAQIRQAQAALDMAAAQQSALFEQPREADLYAANAQIRQAEAALARILEPPEEVDVKAAEANLTLAQVNLQDARNRLSFAKTQSELQIRQAVYQLTQAQWSYALSQRYWEHADENQTDPVNPVVTDATGKAGENEISEGRQASYLAQYEQAKAAMQQAEAAVEQAVIVAESARNAEVSGIQAAEQQVVQAQIALERVLLEPNENDVAQVQAGLDLANANRNRLFPDPNQSQQAQVAAGVAQAQATVDLAASNLERLNPDPTESQLIQVEAGIIEAQSSLELSKLNREYAELRAPFDGIISDVDISRGDPAMSSRNYAVQVVDIEDMYVEVDISDVDISKVRTDQQAIVYADALPGKIFTGRVSYVAPMATIVGNIRTYLVHIELDDMRDLRPGLSVRVEIETGD